ncbi:MAG: hypothetical protein ABIZ70_00975 [Gemmatimonadales bacterium]
MTSDSKILREVLAETRRTSFGPDFTDRTILRWRMRRAPSTAEFILRIGSRAAAVGLAAAAAIALYTLGGTGRIAGQSTAEALLGLAPVTLDVAYFDSGATPTR